MIRLLYTLALPAVLRIVRPLLAVWAARRRPRYREAWAHRWGSTAGLPPHPGTAPLWLHGVSLGEVRALYPLVAAWRTAHPGRPVVISSSTETGLDAARALVTDGVTVTPFPFDTPAAVRAQLEYWRPACIGILETEIWPSFFWACRDRRIPLCLISGRVSERTLRRAGWLRPLWRDVLACVHVCAMQSPEDADRLITLGAAPERVTVLGNLKWDGARAPAADTTAAWRTAWGLTADTPLVLWGSTHDGEERLAVETWQALRRQHPGLRLCVVPRHPERFDAVAAEMRSQDVRVRRRSQGPDREWDVLVLDSIGELATTYAAATVAVLGGTFAHVGGHNVLEPLAARVPLLVGPHTQNVRALVAAAETARALRRTTAQELAPDLAALLADPKARAQLAENGQALIQRHRGTVDRLLHLLDGLWPADVPCEP